MTKISRTTDMTQGSEMRHIIMFSLPLLAGNLLQQTYNIVDTMVVGRYLGDDALAAVGATGHSISVQARKKPCGRQYSTQHLLQLYSAL